MVERTTNAFSQYKEERVGTNDNYTVSGILFDNALLELKDLINIRVSVTVRREQWIYQYDENEEHSEDTTTFLGILKQVTDRKIAVQVESGEISYDVGGKVPLKAGEIINVPFHYEEFHLRKYAKTVKTSIVQVAKQNADVNNHQAA